MSRKPATGMINTQRVATTAFGVAPRKHFHVTQEDIDTAVCNSPGKCMLAQMCKRMGLDRPLVGFFGDGTMAFSRLNPKTGEKERYVYRHVPLEVIKAIYRFDAGQTVEPFEFSLENGLKYRIYPWIRTRRNVGAVTKTYQQAQRKDKGALHGRTLRRAQIQAVLSSCDSL